MTNKNILVTGGAGFIGGHFVDLLMEKEKSSSSKIVVLDKLTYAARPERLTQFKSDPRFEFITGDICDEISTAKVMSDFNIEVVVNFAAESHVDNSLIDAYPFMKTNVEGVRSLLNVCLRQHVEMFVQISTDEVYGQGYGGHLFTETDPYRPRNPYSSSKVEAEKLVKSYCDTSSLKYLITRGCNSFGPWQHSEKLIPKVILNALSHKKVPIYGRGDQKREWIAAVDHAGAVLHLLSTGYQNEVFNIGSGYEVENINVVKRILNELGKPESLITYVEDRLNHDYKYGVNTSKIKCAGWKPSKTFHPYLIKTINHYKHIKKQGI